MAKPTLSLPIDNLATNIQRLETFWNRQTFHDAEIGSIIRTGGRIIFTLDEYVLVLTGATKYNAKTDDFPDVWLYDEIKHSGDSAILTITTESGSCAATFKNLRLIRREDYAILIPELD